MLASLNVPCRFTLSVLVCVLNFVGIVAQSADSLDFLAFEPAWAADIKSTLLFETKAAMTSEQFDMIKKWASKFKTILKPRFYAMPKNENGQLGQASVRYLLHRLFVDEYAWYIRGLDPAGQAWNASSPIQALDGTIPVSVQVVIDQKLAGQGLNLPDLALVGALLRYGTHVEATQRLRAAYELFKVPMKASISRVGVEKVLDTYMAYLLIGRRKANAEPTAGDMRKARMEMRIRIFDPPFEKIQGFVRRVTWHSLAGNRMHFTWNDVVSVLKEVNEGFGKWQNSGCLGMKSQLTALAEDNTGRIRLANFHRATLGGKWQFQESFEYLRDVGALDTSNSTRGPQVLVPNYLLASSNCLATSSTYYKICCIDECIGLLGRLEQKLRKPAATPGEITATVGVVQSQFLSAGKGLPASLEARLGHIADLHGGRVPLHGRLFAQWMHYAYPYECPYPHLSGTTDADDVEDFGGNFDQFISHIVSSKGTMQLSAKGIHNTSTQETSEPMPQPHWSTKEELLVPKQVLEEKTSERHWASSVGFGSVLSLVALGAAWKLGVSAYIVHDADSQQSHLLV